jgi:lipopolysaccharide biosynthesis glycosyltransferase
MKNLKIFIGYDKREKVAYHVLSQSIIENSSIPVTITPINLSNIRQFYRRKKNKNHSTEFSISRFLTPYMSNYEGYSLFLDCDFIVLGNIEHLLKLVKKDKSKAVWCVKHSDYSKNFENKIKFLNEKQLPYQKKNWSSFMIFNNKKCRILTPKKVKTSSGLYLHQFKWTKEKMIGRLPANWNILVGEQKIPKKINAIHYTLGGPYFPEYKNCQGSKFWHYYRKLIF